MKPYLRDLGASGAYPHLEKYWEESTRYPFIVLQGRKSIGFALVRKIDDEPTFELAEFYIAAAFRNRGFGRETAEMLFGRYRGAWCVAVRRDNPTGQAFWTAVFSKRPFVSAVELKAPDGIMYKFFVKGIP